MNTLTQGRHRAFTRIPAAMFLSMVSLGGLAGCASEIDVAVQKGDIGKIKSLLDAHRDLVSDKGKHGSTPLHLAALSGNVEVAQLLLSRNAPVNAKDRSGWTPLHNAAATGHSAMAELLVADHADVNAQDEHGKTPLHWALLGNHKETAKVLLDHGGHE